MRCFIILTNNLTSAMIISDTNLFKINFLYAPFNKKMVVSNPWAYTPTLKNL